MPPTVRWAWASAHTGSVAPSPIASAPYLSRQAARSSARTCGGMPKPAGAQGAQAPTPRTMGVSRQTDTTVLTACTGRWAQQFHASAAKHVLPVTSRTWAPVPREEKGPSVSDSTWEGCPQGRCRPRAELCLLHGPPAPALLLLCTSLGRGPLGTESRAHPDALPCSDLPRGQPLRHPTPVLKALQASSYLWASFGPFRSWSPSSLH